jgi:hypothetical protein
LEVRQHPGHDHDVRLTILGHHLPVREFCRPDGSTMGDVHVGVQLRRDPSELVPADAADATWDVEIDVSERDGEADFRGPAVQGKRGERFVYLTWGNVGADGEFEMFRRAKLMLHRIDPPVLERARRSGHLVARVDLTDARGGPRCARVDPPAIEWSAGRR